MDERPARLSLVNLGAPKGARPWEQVLKAQFNPEELSIALKAVWSKVPVPGMSHPIRQFSHTDSAEWEFTLTFRVTTPSSAATEKSFQRAGFTDFATPPQRGGVGVPNARIGAIPMDQQDTRFSIEDRERAENFLRALTVPCGVGTIYEAAPPTVLVVWPGYCSFEAHVESVRIQHTRFNINGSPTFTTAAVSISDVHDMRFTSQDVMIQGFNSPRVPKPRSL